MNTQLTDYRITLYWDGRYGSDDFPNTSKVVRGRGPLDAIRRAAADWDDPAGGDFRFLHDPIAARDGKRLREGMAYLVDAHCALWVTVRRVPRA